MRCCHWEIHKTYTASCEHEVPTFRQLDANPSGFEAPQCKYTREFGAVTISTNKREVSATSQPESYGLVQGMRAISRSSILQ